MSRLLALYLLLLTLLTPAAAQAAEGRTLAVTGEGKRIALVVGNDSYRHVRPLRNARADARAIADALRGAGFEVTLKFDLGDKAMREAMRHFKARIEGGDEAVFYFAGHGVQIGATNYLLPVDITDENEEQVKDDALPLQRVLDDLQEQKARFSLAIVDACRDNPFKGKGRNIGGRGLAPTNPATGQMVLYSAGAGQQALDRLTDADRDPNGLFTRVLLKEMSKPGVPVDRVLRAVRDQVVRLAKSVNHEQVPALYDQAIGEFYFRAGTAHPDPVRPIDTPVQRPVVTAPSADPVEVAYWAEVVKAEDAEGYKAYLAAYPNGPHAADASAWLERNRLGREAKARQREDQAWSEAQGKGTHASYSAYLQAYPLGHYAPLARLKQRKLGEIRDCPACPEMVTVPGGNFLMGSPSGEAGRSAAEEPQHRVVVGSFAMGKTEISRGQFAAFVSETGHDAGNSCNVFDRGQWVEKPNYNWRNPGFRQDDDHPVVCINWHDARAYARWLSRKTGRAYRLPSEAEWEYAARAGALTSRYWGDQDSQACEHANVADLTAKGQLEGMSAWKVHPCADGHAYTAPAGAYAANAFGLHDMIGNAWEWVEDCWHGNYNGAPADGSAWTQGACDLRVLRGASWDNRPEDARAAERLRTSPLYRFVSFGFRLVRPIGE